jgi:HEAT repeat protein
MGFTATAIAHLGADAVRTDIVEGLLGGLGKGRQQHAIANALAALGQTEAKSKMVKVLKKGLHAPTNKQLWQAAEALGRVDLKVIINYILGRIRSALRPGSNQRMALKTTYTLLEPGFRKMAQEVCAANQVDHKAMDAAKPFQPLLDHANEYLRVVAAWVLEVTGLADEIAGFDDAILKLLKSDVLAIRLLSLDVIGMRGRLLKRPDAAVLLLDLAMAGRFALPRIRDAVSRFGSTAILRAWPKYWANLASDLTRPWLAKAIEILKNCKNAVGTKDVLRCLVGILQPRDPPVPEHLLTEGLQVVSRLGATANQRTVIECLINLTAHEDPGIRALSAKALGTIRVDSSLPGVSDALRRLVIDENVAVRRAATVAANRIDPKLAQQNLVEAQWVPAGSKAANRKLSQIVGRLAPGAVTPEILQQMMTAPRKRPGEIPSSWRGIARLMDQGLRIFQQAEDEHGRRWLSRTVDALSRVGAELLEGPADSSRQPAAEEGKLALREPHKQMVIAYRLAIVQGRPQAEIAAEISKLRKKRTSQGTISRWIARVVEWIKAGNVLPDMPGRSGRPRSIDPKVIDMGARQDSRTPRQRGKRKDEDE